MNISIRTLLIIFAALIIFYMLFATYKHNTNVKDFFADPDNILPTFEEIPAGFDHVYADKHHKQPIIGMTLANLGKGYEQVILIGGGAGQANAALVYTKTGIKDVAQELGLSGDMDDATYAFAAGDINNDGHIEVIIGQDSGLYLYKKATENAPYVGEKMDIDLPPSATPTDIQLVDIRNDGILHMYVSTFIHHTLHSTANFNDPEKRTSNVFFVNDGAGNFEDKTVESGLDLHHNTFLTSFVDLNNNGYKDIIVGANTAKGYIYENNRDGTFTEHALPIGYGFWMGIATGDITGNGYPDIYLANAAKAVPAFMMKGDLRDDQELDVAYRLLKNNGDFTFEDIAKEIGLDNSKFGRGMVFDDFTNNGKLDAIVTENFIGLKGMHKMFPSGGKFYIQGSDGTFVNVAKEAGIYNPYFGYRVISVDVNGNGYNDVIIGNIDGPLRVFINKGNK